MPHENVNSSIAGVVTVTDPDGQSEIPAQRIQVIWAPAHAATAYGEPDNGYVQLVSEWLNSPARMPSPKLVEIEDSPGDFTEGEPTWSEVCNGLAVTLTRDDINHLIRKLRRARDAAFGADA